MRFSQRIPVVVIAVFAGFDEYLYLNTPHSPKPS